MKSRILSFLAAVAAFLTVVGGLELSGLINLLPSEVATGLATILPLGAGVVHLVKSVGDFVDDGQINGSFKSLAVIFVGVLAFGCLPSCAGLGSAISGAPIHTTPVQRSDGSGKPFALATSDLLRAETLPDRQWGLYDAGFVAARATEVIDSGK